MIIPNLFPSPSSSGDADRKGANSIHFSPLLDVAARAATGQVFAKMKTGPGGLEENVAAERLALSGPNTVVSENHRGWPWRLLTALRNPLVLLLLVLAAISFGTGDPRAGSVMTLMVVLGVSLRFIQESRADVAAAKLKEMITVNVAVMRAGIASQIPLRDLVPGDLVTLAAGDMIPADVRVIAAKDLFVSQAALTGESLPVEKFQEVETEARDSALELSNICFLGTSVQSGAATAVVLATGAETYFGGMAGSITAKPAETSFDLGVKQFTWMMIRLILIMVPLVFVINGLTKHDWREAFFFSMAVAVGLTPEMLPMIVSVCLSKGALAMSRKKVIVKQLSAIQNFGAMDVLCADKTGTLTMDQVILQKHCDVMKRENDGVFLDAFLISHFQTGLRNMLDRAVLAHPDAREELLTGYRKVDEIPFDFVRRMMSVVVELPDGDHRLFTKGAPEAIFPLCDSFELDGKTSPLEPERAAELILHYQELSSDGFRVLAVAYKHFTEHPHITTADESGLTLKGYIAFLDPPKDSAARSIKALQAHGVTVKVLTGDNDLVTAKVCREVGLDPGEILTGSMVESMENDELAEKAENSNIFARLSPDHKQRIIRALQGRGHVVGFLGDGINDSPALHVADVGISVDSAVDIAKAAATVILLEKDLMVLDDGVVEGRKVFVNILKYVRMGASSNFGNMFSVLGASAFLPFIPMAPIQVLTNNLLYDFSQLPIPTDNVESDQTSKPRPWNLGELRKFVLFIGPISSIFDYTTFLVMFHFFGWRDPAHTSLFQTGWFVESLITQTLIIHVIRTDKLPFIRSRASWQLSITTLLVMAVAMLLPFSPLAAALGFSALPSAYWPLVGVTALCYVIVTQGLKSLLVRKTVL